PGLENGKQAGRLIKGPLEKQCNPHPRPRTKFPQMLCQMVAAHLQIAKGQLLVAMPQGHGQGSSFALRLEASMNGMVSGVVLLSRVPFDQQLTSLIVRQ